MIANDDMRVEIIFKAHKSRQRHSHATSQLALQIGLNEWAK